MRAAQNRSPGKYSPDKCPSDFRLALHHSLSDTYEMSQVLLARAGFDGSLQLLTCGWERALAYQPEELKDKTLLQLMGSNPRTVAAAAAAILDDRDMRPVEVRFRCGDGGAKGFRLHRHYDRHERTMYIVAEETAVPPASLMRADERREEQRRICERRS